MVLNIEDTVAVTQNFANRANLDDVCDAMIYEAEREPKRAEIWNTFRAALSAQHPNLTSFVDRRIAVYADSAKPTEDSYIVAEGYKTKAEYHDMFHDLKLWKHRVVELLERHGLGEQEREASGGEEILMELVAGQNPIFRTPTTIIKFYSHLYGGTPSHHAEVSSLTRLHEHLPPNYGAQLPRLFASGTLFTDGHKGWNWPYVVIQVVNAISVGNVWGGQWGGRRVGNGGEDEGEDEDGDENGNGDVDGDGDGDGDGDEGGGENGIVEWEETVDWVAEMLKGRFILQVLTLNNEMKYRRFLLTPCPNSPPKPPHPAVHSIPPDDTFAPTHLGWTAFLANKLRTAVTRHRSWAIFPSHLLDQLEAYLPASVEELVPEDRARWATLLHGDLNPDNVMGYIDVVGYVEAVTPPPQLNAPPAEPPQIVYAPPPGPPPPVIYSPPPGPPPSAVYSPPPGPPPPAIYSPQPGPTPVVYAPPPGPPPLLDQPIVTTTSSADVDPPNRIPRYHWRPTHLIDFGDAHPSGGDPLFDLVPFVVTTLGCRKDLMQRFVDVYNRGEGPRIEKKEFVRRALCYVLLWEFPGIPKAVVKCVPALKACGSWKEVEEVVWGGVWE
ncbi:hypothetical protein BC936DRAFT_141639 [Jimgerdemannia flammicorona]|uniref:Aminoglycoside phosphotransferase domain-containing protein n=1 Tax=Jimgerdemannia flammicorona TaxID=994334 RepID=A0A433A1U5_9FUNG|nr:hypothetical protein BC936DRAFT_141639 [Jimgerdemannia flammicorona]